SLELDVALFGPDPRALHLTSLGLHVANVLLLFVLFRVLTATHARSAMAAALFAVHPLHVESVAWVAERKDVLSTFFGLLAILSWLGYVRAPTRGRYVAAVLAFTASLMAKPMLVTLPVLLLLLDWWPLCRVEGLSGRGRWRRWQPLVVEKLPLAAVAAAAVIVAVSTQHRGENVSGVDTVPIAFRAGHTLVAYV